jgi:uncharacterized iron-regulated membrane protein
MRIDHKPEGIRQSMSWLHTWTGIVLGWLLYVIFFTGTLSYFQDEISLWMKPELHQSVPTGDVDKTVQTALAGMQTIAPNATVWTLNLPTERRTTVSASWREPGQENAGRAGTKRAELDAATGEPITARETRGGGFLYRFHFELHSMPRAVSRWIVGIATMFMFVAIISGVITHKKIFTDFFTFRPRKGQRSWLDAHNVTAVLALPFHIMITFSGLLLLMATLMPWPVDTAYQGDRQAYNAERRGGGGGGGGDGAPRRGARQAADAQPVDLATAIVPMLAQAHAQWPGRAIGTVTINKPNKPGATIELREHGSESLLSRGAARRLRFDAASGKLREQPDPAPQSTVNAIYNVVVVAHLGDFAGPVVRWLLFLSGVMGTAMVGTGLVLWVVKRLPERRKLGRTPWGHHLVEKTNIAVVTGLALATAGYFWLNRLLPADMAGRLDWEIKAFFIVWLVSLLHAVVRPARAAWIEQCMAACILFALLPLLNPITGGHGLISSLMLGQMSIAGFDLAMLALASIFAVIAAHLVGKARRAAAPAVKAPAISSTSVTP